jgi:hypothetical protein
VTSASLTQGTKSGASSRSKGRKYTFAPIRNGFFTILPPAGKSYQGKHYALDGAFPTCHHVLRERNSSVYPSVLVVAALTGGPDVVDQRVNGAALHEAAFVFFQDRRLGDRGCGPAAL